jgi:hypothetical protein
VWAYCLMPNHVHLILNPRQADRADDGLVTVRPVLIASRTLLNCYRRPKIRTLRTSGWMKEAGDRLERQSSLPASNDCSAGPSHAVLQDANPRPPSPAYN